MTRDNNTKAATDESTEPFPWDMCGTSMLMDRIWSDGETCHAVIYQAETDDSSELCDLPAARRGPGHVSQTWLCAEHLADARRGWEAQHNRER